MTELTNSKPKELIVRLYLFDEHEVLDNYYIDHAQSMIVRYTIEMKDLKLWEAEFALFKNFESFYKDFDERNPKANYDREGKTPSPFAQINEYSPGSFSVSYDLSCSGALVLTQFAVSAERINPSESGIYLETFYVVKDSLAYNVKQMRSENRGFSFAFRQLPDKTMAQY